MNQENRFDEYVKETATQDNIIGYATTMSEEDKTVLVKSCLFFGKIALVDTLLSAMHVANVTCDVFKFAPMKTFNLCPKNDLADIDISKYILAVAVTKYDMTSKAAFLVDFINEQGLSLVACINTVLTDTNHKYCKEVYQMKLIRVAYMTMIEYDYIEMLQDPNYTLLCSCMSRRNTTVPEMMKLILQATRIGHVSNFAAILNKISFSLEDSHLAEIFDAIIVRGSVPFYKKFQKLFGAARMNKVILKVPIYNRREYIRTLANYGHIDLYKEIKSFWSSYVSTWADIPSMTRQAAHSGNISFLTELEKEVVDTGAMPLDIFYETILDAANEGSNHESIVYVYNRDPDMTKQMVKSSILDRVVKKI